jgi:sugar phosphate permease
MQLGGLLASGLTAELLPQLGWRQTFLRYSLVGVVWGIAFYAWFRNRPEEHRGTNAAERDLIRGQTEPVAEIREDDSATESSASDFPFNSEPTAAKSDEPSALSGGALLWAMLTSASLWAVCGQQFFRAFSYELFTSWFPAYLEKGHGMQVVKSGKWGMLPIFGVLLGSLLGGWVVDALMTRTGSKRLSRSGAAMFAMVLCAACIQTAATAQSPELMVGIIALGMFFWALSGPAAWAATLDISGRHSAILFGLMNMCGNLGALACPIVLGYLFRQISASHGDWNLVLYVFVGINLAGAACWAVLDPNRPVVAARNSEHAPP